MTHAGAIATPPDLRGKTWVEWGDVLGRPQSAICRRVLKRELAKKLGLRQRGERLFRRVRSEETVGYADTLVSASGGALVLRRMTAFRRPALALEAGEPSRDERLVRPARLREGLFELMASMLPGQVLRAEPRPRGFRLAIYAPR